MLAPGSSGGTLGPMKKLLAMVAAAATGWLSGCAPANPRAANPAAPAPNVPAVEHVDAKGAAALLGAGGVVVLDIRTPQEFAAGHIRGARLVDFKAADFAEQLAKLDRKQKYLVHCASGRRSSQSLATFQELGFPRVVHLDGGFNSWAAAGNPVEK